MGTQSKTLISIKRWLVGVLLSTAAMFLGYGLGSETAGLLGGEPGIWARLGKGFVWGAVMAVLQWPIVRTVGVLPIWFLVVSAAGFALGYPLAHTIQGILDNRGLNWIVAYGWALVILGLSLGMPQWWIFRRHMQHASLWILISMIGWMLTGVAWMTSGAGSGEDAIAYGIVTGLGLVWLVRSQQPNAKAKGSINEIAVAS